ncbi:MAG: hypothetical protein K2F75_00010, partial [Paramuribaculum sp.]|nr:hypothetical protein [Paramuribaculum sp.]
MNRLIAFLFTAFILSQPMLAQDEISESSEYSENSELSEHSEFSEYSETPEPIDLAKDSIFTPEFRARYGNPSIYD